MFAPKITLQVATAVVADIQFPEFELTIDEGDGDLGDGGRDFVGVFETEVASHTVNFYGPTPEHVIGLAHLYAGKLTGGAPYHLVVDAAPEISPPQLP